MALKRFITKILGSYKVEAILSSVGLGTVVILIFHTYPDSLAPSDTIQISALVVLVIVTLSYAISTRKIYEVALNSEMNAVVPILRLEAQIIDPQQIRVTCHNVGKGPALNLRMWLEAADDQFLYLKAAHMKSRAFRAAVAADEGGPYTWNDDEGPLPDRSSGFDIVAEYSDVYRRSFVSKLVVINHEDQELSFGRAKEQR